MFDAPQADSQQTDKGDPVLLHRERLLGWSNSLDLNITFTVRRASRLIRPQQQPPNEDDRYSRNGQSHSKPLRPVERWVHLLQRDDILR